MTLRATPEPSEGVDLWVVAGELAVTPDGDDPTTRRARRRTRRGREFLWSWLAAGAVSFLAGVAGLLVGSTSGMPLLVSIAIPIGVLGLMIAAATVLLLLRAGVYRTVTVLGHNLRSAAWWTTTLLSLGLTAVATAAAVLVLPHVDEAARATWSVQVGIVGAAGIGLLFAVGSSALMPPLLLATAKERPYQSHWSQVTWTIGLMGMTICIASSALTMVDQPVWVPEVTITVGFALLAATWAWHARALANLRAARAELLAALQHAIQALPAADTVPDPAGLRGAVDALLALEALLSRDPFRSQSPAAPPPPAAWEVTQIVQLGLYAAGHLDDVPASITSRAHLPGELGDRFRQVKAMPRPQLLRDIRAFLIQARGSLLADSAAQW